MTYYFPSFRVRLSSKMAAGDYAIRRELANAKFVKASTGHFLAWVGDNPSRIALLLPDHPKGEPCYWLEGLDGDLSIVEAVEYVESGRYDNDPHYDLNLFIESVSCSTCKTEAYRCSYCEKTGCSHTKKRLCKNQCFVGAHCVHCKTAFSRKSLADRPGDTVLVPRNIEPIVAQESICELDEDQKNCCADVDKPKPLPKEENVPAISLLDELFELNKLANKWAARHGYPAVEDYPQYARTREIGLEYFKTGGLAGMQAACHALQSRLAERPRAKQDIQLVTYGWANIGGWMV
ncbi:hypothetical protein [Propionivibrio sp.]|uniref:hypothetical protein n=1 Tax=Propionivibrio sp. TaxID=2212460 RepID=UPI003BF38DF2